MPVPPFRRLPAALLALAALRCHFGPCMAHPVFGRRTPVQHRLHCAWLATKLLRGVGGRGSSVSPEDQGTLATCAAALRLPLADGNVPGGLGLLATALEAAGGRGAKAAFARLDGPMQALQGEQQAAERITGAAGPMLTKPTTRSLGRCLQALAATLAGRPWSGGREALRPEVRVRVLTRDRFRCFYCSMWSRSRDDRTVDHWLPRSQGGSDDEVNLVSSCVACNQLKGPLLPDDFEAKSRKGQLQGADPLLELKLVRGAKENRCRAHGKRLWKRRAEEWERRDLGAVRRHLRR